LKTLTGIIGPLCLAGLIFCGIAWSQQPPDKTQPLPVTGLVPDHATLSVENIEKQAAWYERVLGFKVLSKSISNGQDPNWHLVIPGYRIDLVQRKGSKRPALVNPQAAGDRFDAVFQQQGWIHVSFHVEDVATALKRLQVLGVDVRVKKDDKDNPIQIRLEDPEGNEIEIRRNLVL
jgi:catechol 2,3-dioxygenase-like lactoylglutathione lyase family enzyme